MTTERTKIYFASDFHLGVPNWEKSREREDAIVRWLDQIKSDCKVLYLVGDLFDFWFEYRQAIPKGFIRFQGKLAELADSGVEIHFFTGNHDMWMFDYFQKELNVSIHKEPIIKEYFGQTFYIAHGDGLGPGDYGYKFIKKVFANRFCQWLFARLHPNFGIGLANFFSRKSRSATGNHDEKFLGEANEWLAIHSREILEKQQIDFFIYGHRHLPIQMKVGESSQYINLGEWINYQTYVVIDASGVHLMAWEKELVVCGSV